MNLRKSVVLLAAVMGISVQSQGCQSGGVGDPCIPEDEYQQEFPGFSATEVNLESRSFQCETRVCLVYRFRGRVSCPLGQEKASTIAGENLLENASVSPCHIPGSQELVKPVVTPQCSTRTAEKTVYCSCRCDGPDPNAKYCECPDGFACTKLEDLDLGAAVAKGSSQLAGSYCVRKDDATDRACEISDQKACKAESKNCGGAIVNPLGGSAVGLTSRPAAKSASLSRMSA